MPGWLPQCPRSARSGSHYRSSAALTDTLKQPYTWQPPSPNWRRILTEKYVDMTGQRFGSLTGLRLDRDRTVRGRTYWLFRCDCGNEVSIARDKIRTGARTSCGCQTKHTGRFKTMHGMAHAPEYRAWRRILNYCYNEKTEHFQHYGGRGISVHADWVNDFQSFYTHVGPRPSPRHSIDRIDTNGDYAPGNVRWATHSRQMRNTRKTRYATIDGVTRPVADWCDIMGHKSSKIWARMNRHGMSAEEALLCPPMR